MAYSHQQLKDYALNLLSRRDYSSYEMLQKLQSKATEDEASALLQWLQHQDLQSDDRYALNVLRSKSRRGYGDLFIRRFLAQKKVADNSIQAAFAELDVDWFSVAVTAYEKKFSRPLSAFESGTADYLKEKARRQRFLQYRGFNAEHIHYALQSAHQELQYLR